MKLMQLNPFKWSIRTIKFIFTFILVGILTLSTWLVFATGQEVIQAETNRIGADRQALALAGAKRIELYFQSIGSDLQTLSYLEAINGGDVNLTRQLADQLVSRYQDSPFISIVRVDSDGSIIFSLDREGVPVPADLNLSSREYFTWAQQPDHRSQVYLSTILSAKAGPLMGQPIVIIATPIYSQEKYSGVIFASIGVGKLIDDYVVSLSSYPASDALILNDNGDIMAGVSLSPLVGQNVQNLLNAQPPDVRQSVQKNLGKVLSGNNSWVEGQVYLPDRPVKQTWIAGFAPVDFGGKRWVLVARVDKQVVFEGVKNYQHLARWGLVFAGVAVTIVGFLTILGIRLAQSACYCQGFQAAQQAKKQGIKAVGVNGKQSRRKRKH
jgi:hypothetical protein